MMTLNNIVRPHDVTIKRRFNKLVIYVPHTFININLELAPYGGSFKIRFQLAINPTMYVESD